MINSALLKTNLYKNMSRNFVDNLCCGSSRRVNSSTTETTQNNNSTTDQTADPTEPVTSQPTVSFPPSAPAPHQSHDLSRDQSNIVVANDNDPDTVMGSVVDDKTTPTSNDATDHNNIEIHDDVTDHTHLPNMDSQPSIQSPPLDEKIPDENFDMSHDTPLDTPHDTPHDTPLDTLQ